MYGYGFGNVYGITLISLTDGHVIYHQRYSDLAVDLVASPDGRYVAEQYPDGVTQIRELPSGEIVGLLTGVYVRGFSWDWSLVAVDTSNYAGPGEAQVIDWRTNHVLWRMADDSFPAVLARPFGTEIAVAVRSPRDRASGIYDIQPNARVTVITSGPESLRPF